MILLIASVVLKMIQFDTFVNVETIKLQFYLLTDITNEMAWFITVLVCKFVEVRFSKNEGATSLIASIVVRVAVSPPSISSYTSITRDEYST